MRQEIWLCHIDHKHGENYTAHATEQKARQAALDYVLENWASYDEAEDYNGSVLKKMTADQRIELYFERAGHFGGEWLRIECLEVQS